MSSRSFSRRPKLNTPQWVAIGVAGIAAMALLMGLVIQVLWNTTLTQLFTVPAISFWQALGLFVLAKIFFGFGLGGSSSSSSKQRRKARSDSSTDAVPSISEASDTPIDEEPLVADERFKEYWQREGRAAFAEYRRRASDIGEDGT